MGDQEEDLALATGLPRPGCCGHWCILPAGGRSLTLALSLAFALSTKSIYTNNYLKVHNGFKWLVAPVLGSVTLEGFWLFFGHYFGQSCETYGYLLRLMCLCE